MKSSFLEKSKRALVLLLTGAMIATSVPSTAFAAAVGDDDVIIEEVTDAVAQDAVVEKEVVADEPSDVVEALGAEDDFIEGEDKVDADDASNQIRTLTIGAATTSDAPNVNATYGVSFEKVDVEAWDNTPSTAAKYSGVEWTLYKLTDQDDTGARYGNGNTSGALKDFCVAKTAWERDRDNTTLKSNLEQAENDLVSLLTLVPAVSGVNTLAPGVKGSQASGKYTIEKDGVPTQVGTTKFVLKVTDSDNPNNAAEYSDLWTLTVADATGFSFGDTDAGTGVTGVSDFEASNDITQNDINFDATDKGYVVIPEVYWNGTAIATKAEADMNYTVPSEAQTPKKTGDRYVNPLKLALKVSTEATFDDLQFSMTDLNGIATDNFTVTTTPGSVVTTGSLSKNAPLYVYVAPKAGLAEKSDNTYTDKGLYVGVLNIKSAKALTNPLAVKVAFTVNNDIDLKLYKDGKIFSTNDTGAENDPIVIGDWEVGKLLSTLQFKATGGAQTLTIAAETETESGSPIASLDVIEDTLGLSLNPIEGSKSATATLDGTIKLDAGLSDAVFGLTASDEAGNKKTVYYQITPTKNVFELKADSKNKTETNTKSITGTVAKTNTIDGTNKVDLKISKTDKIEECITTIEIKNTTDATIKLEGALVASLGDGTKNTVVNGSSTGADSKAGTWEITSPAVKDSKYTVEIEAGATGSFTIVPKTTTNISDVAMAQEVFRIVGAGFATTDVIIKYTQATNDIEYTLPSADPNFNSGKVEYGKEYSYAFDVTKSSAVQRLEWVIAKPAIFDSTGKTKKTSGTSAETNIVIDENTGLDITAEMKAAGLYTAGTTTVEQIAECTTVDDESFRKKFGLTLNPNGTIEGTATPEKDKDWSNVTKTAKFVALIKCFVGGNPSYTTIPVELSFIQPDNAVSLFDGTTELNETSTVDMGTTKSDVKSTKKITIKNNTSIDLTGVEATITGVNYYENSNSAASPLTGDASNYGKGFSKIFKLVYSDNSTVEAFSQANGATVKAGEDWPLTVESVPATSSSATAKELKAGIYELTITVAKHTGNTTTFFTGADKTKETTNNPKKLVIKMKLTVEEAPVITAKASTIDGSIKTGTEVTTGANKGFAAALKSDATRQFEYTWKNADGTAFTNGTLTLNPSGKISGKAAKAGSFKILVTATTSDSKTPVLTGTQEFEMVIAGEATIKTLSAKNNAGTTTNIYNPDGGVAAGKTWVLPGQVNGADATAVYSQVTMELNNDADAGNVSIVVEDADDDRKADKITATNPYDGSTNYIGVSVSTFNDVKKGSTHTFNITAKNIDATTKEGEYRVKITVSSDKMTPVSFYASLVVVDKLEISQIASPVSVMVGEEALYELEASGADDRQKLTWSEVTDQTTTGKVTPDDKISNAAKLNMGIHQDTTATIARKDTNGDKKVSSLDATIGLASTGSGYTEKNLTQKGIPANIKKGGYDVTVKAVTDGAQNFVDTNKATSSDFLNKTNTIPVQTAYMTFKIVVSESTKLSLQKLNRVAITGSQLASTETKPYTDNIIGNNVKQQGTEDKYFDEGIIGELINGNAYSSYTGYNIKPNTVAYDATKGVTIKLENLARIDQSLKVALTGDTNSPFDIYTIKAKTGSKTATRAKKNDIVIAASADGTTPGTASLLVVPKTGLTVKDGGYTDTLTVKGDYVKDDITFTINFEVQPATYKASASYYALGTSALTADPVELTPEEGTIGTIVLKDNVKTADASDANYAIRSTSNSKYIKVENTGNSTLYGVTVTETDANGNALSTAKKKLDFYQTESTAGNDSAALTLTNAGDIDSFTIQPKSLATAESVSTYVCIKYQEGTSSGAIKRIIIPVTYTVANSEGLQDKVTVSPLDDQTMTAVNEGYAASATTTEFTITNDNDEGNTNELVDVVIAVEPNFVLRSNSATAATNGTSKLLIDSIAAKGTPVTFTVEPKTGLPAKNYSTDIVINAANLTPGFIRHASVKVNTSETLAIDVYKDADTTTLGDTNLDQVDKGFAERIYNTLKAAKAKSNAAIKGNNITGTFSDDNGKYVDLDLDGNGTAETKVTFAYSASTGAGAVTVNRIASEPISRDSITLTLSDDEITELTKNDTDTNKTPYFKALTFNYFTAVSFDVTPPTVSYFTADVLDLKDNDNVILLGTDDNSTLLVTKVTEATNVGKIIVRVPNGKTLADVFGSGKVPKAGTADKAFEAWESTSKRIADDTPIVDTTELTPFWHEHKYASSVDGNNNYVSWQWTGFTAAKVTLKCTDPSCPDASHTVVLDGTTSPATTIKISKKEANCTEGPHTEYLAKVEYLGKTYTDKKIDESGAPLGHDWRAKVAWTSTEETDAKTGKKNTVWTPAVTLECKVCGEKYEVPAADVVCDIDTTTKPATCLTAGEVTYTIKSYKDDKGNVVTTFPNEAITVKKEVSGALGHTAVFTVSDFNEDTLKANVVVDCPVDNVKIYEGELTATANADGTFHFTVTVDGVEYTYDWSNHDHVWGEPEWTYTVTAGVITGTAKFTCTPADSTIKPHDETSPIIVGTPTEDGSFKIYEITAKDPAGKEYKYDKTITLDADGNEVKGEAKTWQATYSTSGLGTSTPSVSIVFTGDNGAVDKVTVTPEAKVNGDITTYSIAVKDRAGKTHKMSWDYKKPATEGGEPTITPGTEKTSGTDASVSEGEISVSFAVDPDTDDEGNPQFTFTGAAIKPALVIRDEDRDVTLAQGVDYTLKWATNKAVGTAVVTVMGKGNYAGKNVTLSYKIADLKLGTDDFAVKKIKGFGTFTNGTDTGVSAPAYDGNAWTPEEITVTDANGADVVLKLQADGTYASEDSKTTAISIANNVNKGSATVSAINAKGKVVKKTFKIAAANLAAASESDLTFDPDEAVYAAKGAVPANLNVEYKGQELVLGQDYTVKYSYASKTKDAGEKAGMFTITGKGNFAGKAAQKSFDIAALELEDDAAAVSVFDKAAVKSIKPTISDGNGVAIPARQLKVTVVKHGESDDTTLAPKDKVFAGDKLTITVEGVNDKNISEKAEFDVTVAANLGKAKVAVPSGFTKYYTGEAIELTDEDMEKIAVTINKTTTLKYGEDFEIAGYQNNIKKGSMTVTLRGISEKCSGTKTFKVKITPKTMKKAD